MIELSAIPPAVELERDDIILKREIAAMEAALELRRRHAELKRQCEALGVDVASAPLRLPDIVAIVARKYRVTEADIMGPSHKRHASQPRHEVMYLAYEQRWADGRRRYSYPQIGAFLGGRDHTTVIAGIRRHKQRLAEEASLSGRPQRGSQLGAERKRSTGIDHEIQGIEGVGYRIERQDSIASRDHAHAAGVGLEGVG